MKKTMIFTVSVAAALCVVTVAAQNAGPSGQNSGPSAQSADSTARDTAAAFRSLFRAVKFNYKSSSLDASSYYALDSIAVILKRDEYKRYEIQGYSDSVGPPTYNRLLSGARAGSVREYLISKGAHEANIVAIGYGKIKPVASNRTEDGRAANRRVEIAEIDSWDKFYALKQTEEKQRARILSSHFKWEGKPEPAKPKPKPAAEPEPKAESAAPKPKVETESVPGAEIVTPEL